MKSIMSFALICMVFLSLKTAFAHGDVCDILVQNKTCGHYLKEAQTFDDDCSIRQDHGDDIYACVDCCIEHLGLAKFDDEGDVIDPSSETEMFHSMIESKMDDVIEQVEAIGRQQEITTIAELLSVWTSEAYLMVIVTSVLVLSALNLTGIVLVIKTMRRQSPPLLSKS